MILLKNLKKIRYRIFQLRKKAVKGLTAGLAEGLGVDPGLVEITRTEPDLLGGEDRRLSDSDATLVVKYYVCTNSKVVQMFN